MKIADCLRNVICEDMNSTLKKGSSNLMNDYSRFTMEGLRIFLEMNDYRSN